MRVTFDPAYEDGDKAYAGTFHADPAYPGTSADSHDIAVVVLDRPIKGIEPAALPKANSLSALSGSQTFTSVGYGAYEVTNGPGGHRCLTTTCASPPPACSTPPTRPGCAYR